MIERGVLSRTVKLQLVVSKNAVEQRKATTTIFKCVLRSAVPSSSSWGVSLQQSIAFILTIARLDTPKE
ncbi:MAG: hypothetical protein WAN68_18800 [Pseudolabrys sp.]